MKSMCTEVNDEQHDASQMGTSEIEYNLASPDIEELIEDAGTDGSTSTTVEFDGNNAHKAIVVKEMSNSDANSSSYDMLRRVRGYSENVVMPGADDYINTDECVIYRRCIGCKGAD